LGDITVVNTVRWTTILLSLGSRKPPKKEYPVNRRKALDTHQRLTCNPHRAAATALLCTRSSQISESIALASDAAIVKRDRIRRG
jgi:hypothetical protein